MRLRVRSHPSPIPDVSGASESPSLSVSVSVSHSLTFVRSSTGGERMASDFSVSNLRTRSSLQKDNRTDE